MSSSKIKYFTYGAIISIFFNIFWVLILGVFMLFGNSIDSKILNGVILISTSFLLLISTVSCIIFYQVKKILKKSLGFLDNLNSPQNPMMSFNNPNMSMPFNIQDITELMKKAEVRISTFDKNGKISEVGSANMNDEGSIKELLDKVRTNFERDNNKSLKDMSLDELNGALKQAISNDEFENAAAIRDEINQR